jgi:hypothetical protein
MKKIWIPALFVLCGTLGSQFWSRVALSCDVPHAEFVAAAAIPVVTYLANEILSDGEASSAVRSGVQASLEFAHLRDMVASFSIELVFLPSVRVDFTLARSS